MCLELTQYATSSCPIETAHLVTSVKNRRNELSLDSHNFFLADVRDGLGPYLAIYLLAVHKWDPASIGLVMTLAGVAALLAQAPAGALIDRTHAKRTVVIVAALLVTCSCLQLPWLSSFTLVALTQTVSAIASYSCGATGLATADASPTAAA